MPTHLPRPDADLQPDVLGVVGVCAFLLGAAVLLLDHHSGAPDHRGLLLVIGVICMVTAAVLVAAGPVRRHHTRR